MLERIHLQNFKASRDVNIRTSSLTLLAGLNSSGKSSILQSIAVLRQSYGSTEYNPKNLILGGDLVQLGHGRDVLSEGADGSDDVITLQFRENNVDYCWACRSESDAHELKFNNETLPCPEFVKSPHFQFLRADRVGPSTLYPQASHQAHTNGFLGAHGEFTADYLAHNMDKSVSTKRLVVASELSISEATFNKVAQTPKLLDQVSAWLQHVGPGTRISVARLRGTDHVQLEYNHVGRTGGLGNNNYRSTNVGFGLTYSLPIIVACLAAPSGSLLLLENPEAHLHPQGQAALGKLLALTAADGVQIIVETHSDHLLNGVRLAVKQKHLSCEQVVLNFFTRLIETGESNVESPAILSNGQISDWPVGFFDQWDKSLDALLE